MSDDDTVDLEQLCDLALEVTREAAAMVYSRLGERVEYRTKSSDIDLVTEVDQASEELITSRLIAARPDDGFLGEEGTGIVGSSGVDWVIDPIDGTTSWFYGLPGFSVSVAGRIADQVVVGVVIAPATSSEFWAVRGHGAMLNGKPITCRDAVDLDKALVATGFAPDTNRRSRQGDVFSSFISQIRDVRRMGSAALDLAAVAAGQLDAYFEMGISDWDFAAGLLIAEEAGAVVLVEPDGDSGRSFVAAAAPGIATAFFDMLDNAGARTV